MSEFTNRYYPTICIRRAEMRAMSKLPLDEKKKMLPIVLLAPWLNSINFENTIKTVDNCIGPIPIIADLDSYFESSSPLPSRKFFWELMDKNNGHIKWCELIAENSRYIPTVQTHGRVAEAIEYQIAKFKPLSRGMVFRFELDKTYAWDFVFSKIEQLIEENILCVFDYGYNEPSQIIENKVASLIDRLVTISATAKFVVTGTDFPNEFSEFDNFSTPKSIGSRIIFSDLVKKYGNYNMFYGDWASTKPRRYDGGGSRPLPRVDFPTKASWIIARSKEDQWDFEDAAQRLTRLPEWSSRPQIWGAGMIEKTARGLPGGISTGPEAIACRVNMHLYIQNNFSFSAPPPPPQSKWIDPI